ncbi:MAG: Insecticidal toxin complex protein TccC7, partial [Candidatus Woesebacteria bacterium GW2011_GWB1_38_8]
AKERLQKITVKTLGKIVRVYRFSYKYGWNPAKHNDANNNRVPDAQSEVVNYQTIHSLLTRVAQWDNDVGVAGAKRLPYFTFDYGPDALPIVGGDPLMSFTNSGGGNDQQKTPNDFFLRSADNGFGGSVLYEYWQDANANNAFNIRKCDPDITEAGEGCRVNHDLNSQRHRLAAKIIEDGMGNFTVYSYNYSGSGATQALASVGNYYTLADFEFLGYPEVETTVFEKNSKTAIASKTRTNYFQKIETADCFKASPLKGMPSRIFNYNADNQSQWQQVDTLYKVKFGDMFGTTIDKDSNDLASYCKSYDPGNTVSLVVPTETVTRANMPSPQLCTRNTISYNNLDGTVDPYSLVHKVTDWGKVTCTNTNTDDTSDKVRASYTNYTSAQTVPYMVPKPNESWISDNANSAKYNHSKVYYDYQVFGTLGRLGRVTKTENLRDGIVEGTNSMSFDSTYPWLATKVTDALGHATTTVYDSVFHNYPLKVTNNLGHSVSTEYDFNINDTTHPNYGGVMGIPVRVTDVNEAVSNMVYDTFGRLIETYLSGKKPGVGVKPDSFSKYYYFNEDNMTTCNDSTNCLVGLGNQINGQYGPKMVVVSGTRFSDDGGAGKLAVKQQYYDGVGQEVQTRNMWYENEWQNAGIPVNNTLKDLILSKTYTSLGSVEYQSKGYTGTPYIPSSTNSYDSRNFLTDATIDKTRFIYDGYGRVVTTVYSDGTRESLEYDLGGNPLVSKSSDKNCTDSTTATICTTTTKTMDAFGQTLSVKETAPEKTYETKYEYHPILGVNTRIIDTKGNAVNIIDYDKLGRKIKMWDVDMSPAMSSDANSWRYEYDKNSNLVKQTNPKSVTTELIYDGLTRIKEKKVEGRTLLTNVYDACPNGIGRACQETSYDLSSGLEITKINSQYDKLGRVTSSNKLFSNLPDALINGKSINVVNTYDRGGRLLSGKYAAISAFSLPEETVGYIYNRNYLGSVAGTNNYINSAKYNKDGQLISYKSGNGVVNDYSYNGNNNRLLSLSVTGANIAATDVLNLGYGYDPVGNITNITDNNTANSQGQAFYMGQRYTYDSLQRVTKAEDAFTSNYSYDDIGNILTKKEGTEQVNLTYSTVTGGFYHRPQTVSVNGTSQNYTYDKIGNLTSDQKQNFTYDADNRMIKAGDVNFYYDASGQRIAKLDADGDKTYYLSANLELELAKNGSKVWRRNYYFAGKLASVRENTFSAAGVTPTNVPPTSAPVRGDANGDRIVDIKDYIIWINYYETGATIGPGNNPDFNNDSVVDGMDYVIWQINFGSTAPPP